MVLRTRLRCAPRILGPPRLIRRDSRVSGIQAPGGSSGGDWLPGAGGYGGVGVVENSVGLSCVAFAGGVGVSPSLFALCPRRARAPLFSCSHSYSLALGYVGPFAFTHIVTFRVHVPSRAHIVVSTSASTRPVHASTLARIRSRLVRTSVHHSVFALPRAHSRVTRPHFVSAHPRPHVSCACLRVATRLLVTYM